MSQSLAAGWYSVDRFPLVRLRDYLMGHYLVLHITIVSVALAVAGVSAASLITRPSVGVTSFVLLWLLWLGSLLASAVAYAGTMVGAFALPSAVPAISDLGLPLAMGVIEILLFSILIGQVTSSARLDIILNAWFVLIAAFASLALLSIIRVRSHFTTAIRLTTSGRTGLYTEEAATVIQRYTKYLNRDGIGAGTTSAAGIVSSALRFSGVKSQLADYIFTLTVIVLLAAGLHGHRQTERMWRIRLSIRADRRE